MTHKGFTLTELLVVVIIIATLAAFAMPAYQRAVLKSRYHTLIPITQGVHKGEEVYFAMNRHYTNDLDALPISGTNAEEGTTIVADPTNGYVRVSQTGLNNNYVMYQSHGAYPSEIHCEAKTGDNMANWLCATAMGGTEVGGATQAGYTAYLLSEEALPFEEEAVHEPVDYTNDSGEDKENPLILEDGDTCTANTNNGCQYVDASGEGTECHATAGKQGCANSTFDDKAICTAGDIDEDGVPKAGCQYATFTNGAKCIVKENTPGVGAADTACGGDSSGGRMDETPTGEHSAQYYGAECVNDSTSSFGCGRSWYKEGSTCTSSNTNGGCGNSLFDASRCVARGGNACDKSTFQNGSVCEAWASNTCPKTAETTYDATSYCVGKNNNTSYSYCPKNTPAEAGDEATRKKWRQCTKEEQSAATEAGFSTSGLTCAG